MLMLSIPPARIRSASPARIAEAASMTARSPEPQTMLTVKALEVGGIPAPSATCRAGACPRPAERTLPTIASSTSPGSIPARASASRAAITPSSIAERPERPPR